VIGHALILQEILFNYTTPTGAAELSAVALCVHVFWIFKYYEGVRRRARRAGKNAAPEKLKQEQEQGKQKGKKKVKAAADNSIAATTTSMGSDGKTIQLRIQKSK
ncbi:hypothetical protein BGZ96_010765, partial [Linnemannia gamsii]